jgi:hypothetical protein
MNILFVHQNFPGQFKYLAQALAKDPSNRVVAISGRKNSPRKWEGVEIIEYVIPSIQIKFSPRLADFEVKTIRAEVCFEVAKKLKSNGFTPDVIIAHPSWGESLYLKEVWPSAKLGIYCEFFYRSIGADVNFDIDQSPMDPESLHRFNLKNINHLLHLEIAELGLSPTQWQANTFPKYA